MNPQISPAVPASAPPDAAAAMDAAVHARLSRASLGLSPISLALAFSDWAMHLAVSPGRQMQLAREGLALSGQAWTRAVLPPAAPASADAAPAHDGDPRFSDPAWRHWPYKAFKEGFEATGAWSRDSAKVAGVSRHHQHVVEFFTRQWLDAVSPSNWLLTNPEVLRKGRASLGQSLLKGQKSYFKDLMAQHRARTASGPEALPPLDFEVGRDVAVTPGKVVFRNHLIELIQYTPTTDTVYPEPLLIVPSCIMKYYILDLSPANSMVRYLVAQGYTVFMISWRNPDAGDRDLGLQDYLQMGVMEAMAAIKAQTGAPRIHSLGYCLGGTFLSIVAAALGRPENAPRWGHLPALASVTLLAAQTDFSEPGELGVFIDDDQLQTLRETMARTGYLSGRQMAGSFQFLNSRDLIWSRQTHRYLLGEDEIGNDMMSWNADVTRLPERMHSEYLSSLFLNNALASGHYRVAGTGVALMDIKAPMLVVGTVRDHVSPWRSVYKIHLLTDSHTTFILAAGGHNAGIVSEPGHPRRSYQIAEVEAGHGWTEPEAWMASAPVKEGSWWLALDDWLQARSGARVAPPALHPEQVLGDAPGDYIQVRYAD